MQDDDILKNGISVIIPVDNLAVRKYEMIAGLARDMQSCGYDFEIIAVGIAATVETMAELERASAGVPGVLVFSQPAWMGKGFAMRRGFKASSKGLVCFLDPLPGVDFEQVKRLVELKRRSGAGVVIGSKMHPGSRLDYPWYRRVCSKLYHLFVFLLLGLRITDAQPCIRVFDRETLSLCFPRLLNKAHADLEILVVARLLGDTIKEGPITIEGSDQFKRIRWQNARNSIVETMAIFYRLRILRYYNSPLLPPSDRQPLFSIVIPTRGIDPTVEECLRKCAELEYENYDLKLVADEAVDVELPGRGSEVIVSGPVGPSVKRNLGIKHSDADIIAFIDSDAWPASEWLRNAAPYFEDEEVAAVCGPGISTGENEPRLAQASGLVYLSSLVSGRTTYRYTYHALREVDDFPSCNLLVRRSDLLAAKSFPEEFYPGEDTVLCLRLTKELGKKILYVPNVMVCHHRRLLFRPHMKQVAAYATHRGYFVRKLPETSRRLQYFIPTLFVIGLVLGFIGSFFHPAVFYTYISVLGLYFLLVLLSSVKTIDLRINSLVFIGIFLTNLTYGVGFLRGLFTRRIERL